MSLNGSKSIKKIVIVATEGDSIALAMGHLGKVMFEMPITSIFYIKGHGAVLAGTVAQGEVRMGQKVVIASPTREIETTILGIEENDTQELISSAKAGSDIAVQIPDIDFEALNDGVDKDLEGALVPTDLVCRAVDIRWWQFWRRI